MSNDQVKTTIFDTSVFIKQNEIQWRKEALFDANNLLIYSRHHKRVYYSNPTGGDILLLCDGKHPFSDIVDIIAKKYDTDKMTIRKDTIDFIGFLIKNRFITMRDPDEDNNSVSNFVAIT